MLDLLYFMNTYRKRNDSMILWKERKLDWIRARSRKNGFKNVFHTESSINQKEYISKKSRSETINVMHTLPSTYTRCHNWIMAEAALKFTVRLEHVLEFCLLQQSRGDFHKVRIWSLGEIKSFTYRRQEVVVRLKRTIILFRSRQLTQVSQRWNVDCLKDQGKECNYLPNNSSTNKSLHPVRTEP